MGQPFSATAGQRLVGDLNFPVDEVGLAAALAGATTPTMVTSVSVTLIMRMVISLEITMITRKNFRLATATYPIAHTITTGHAGHDTHQEKVWMRGEIPGRAARGRARPTGDFPRHIPPVRCS